MSHTPTPYSPDSCASCPFSDFFTPPRASSAITLAHPPLPSLPHTRLAHPPISSLPRTHPPPSRSPILRFLRFPTRISPILRLLHSPARTLRLPHSPTLAHPPPPFAPPHASRPSFAFFTPPHASSASLTPPRSPILRFLRFPTRILRLPHSPTLAHPPTLSRFSTRISLYGRETNRRPHRRNKSPMPLPAKQTGCHMPSMICASPDAQ
ncbi:hypothetical protein Uis4E_0671 [Bifidobacterium parmae]|uniref:Uncharacterized protein n=1 Tax=Bifidobacterium parmae TaxID=361854 RepID=A0A2N5J4W5_9BIFI|nr:hypothetical protein Uis4E_0671 [Bifidobacterium parmae]